MSEVLKLKYFNFDSFYMQILFNGNENWVFMGIIGNSFRNQNVFSEEEFSQQLNVDSNFLKKCFEADDYAKKRIGNLNNKFLVSCLVSDFYKNVTDDVDNSRAFAVKLALKTIIKRGVCMVTNKQLLLSRLLGYYKPISLELLEKYKEYKFFYDKNKWRKLKKSLVNVGVNIYSGTANKGEKGKTTYGFIVGLCSQDVLNEWAKAYLRGKFKPTGDGWNDFQQLLKFSADEEKHG